MANLFGKNKLKSVAQTIGTDDVIVFIDIVKKWHHDYHQGTLKQDKETSREQEYNQNFFKDILGYKEKPAVPFNFEPKATTEIGQLPDAVISYTDKANDIKNISAVVELKGASIALDRPQQREGNMSPVQQAFKYKTQYRNCPFVIVSNFWEFRLYRDNLLDYEAWTLDDLVNPDDDYLLFKTWYVLLKSDNFITSKGTSKTENILSDIRIEQENISKKFYKVYKEARLTLLRDIYFRNETVKTDIDMGVEKAQKIIDRVVFTCFAEDRGLLPDNTLQRVIRDAEQSSFGVSLWQAFKGLFEAIDSGSDKLEIPDGYNGGLFKHDEILDNLRISDDGLKPVVELSKYDFTEDLSVSILGHIFEQSISDLEEIKNKVNVDKNVEAIITQSRRKKDGIFYTPDYIVRYIVDNSLGTYLREHEEIFKEEYKLHGDINDKNYTKREKQAYQKYQYFLQNIKVVDPACGSGAFLVYVFDYLMSENQRVGDILGNNIFSTDEYIRDILKNNIYGVDLNEESVEITKLSLWLKSAQKGKKLTSLDNNIKCGNSLIDDPAVAGNKAFNWQNQFSDVFKNGGFDIVVGNPPYVRAESIKEYKSYFSEKYETHSGNADLYVYFFNLGLNILKDKGRFSYITPNKWIQSNYGLELRRYIKKFRLEEIIDFGELRIFEDAGTFPSITTITKAPPSHSLHYMEVKDLNEAKAIGSNVGGYEVDIAELGDSWKLVDRSLSSLINRLEDNHQTLIKAIDTQLLAGVKTGSNKLFIYSGEEVNEIVGDNLFERKLFKKIIFGRDFNKYVIKNHNLKYIFFPYQYLNGKNEPIELQSFPNTYKYLVKYIDNFSERAVIKEGISKQTHQWYELQQLNKFFDYSQPAIIYPDIALENRFIKSDGNIIPDMTCFFFSTDGNYLLPVLNSKMFKFLASKYCPMLGSSSKGGRIRFKSTYLEKIPFPKIKRDEANQLHIFADSITDLYSKKLEQSYNFNKLLASHITLKNNFSLPEGWWMLDFSRFVKILGVNLTLRDKDEIIQLFGKYCNDLTIIEEQIKKYNYQIDQLIYKLYNLTPKEIKIVEG